MVHGGTALQEIRRLSVTIRSGEFDHPCGDLARRGSDLGGGGAFGRLLSVGCEGYGTLSHEECR